MPRLIGVSERRDYTFYDTHNLEPGQSRSFFERDCQRNIGDKFKTNVSVAGQLSREKTYHCLALGARLLGKTRAEEDLLLDHLHINFTLGDRPQHEILGPQASMLRHVFSAEELAELERVIDEPSGKPPVARPPVDARVGYHFVKPIIIPVRQNMAVHVTASKELPEAVTVRVHLLGIQSRNIA